MEIEIFTTPIMFFIITEQGDILAYDIDNDFDRGYTNLILRDSVYHENNIQLFDDIHSGNIPKNISNIIEERVPGRWNYAPIYYQGFYNVDFPLDDIVNLVRFADKQGIVDTLQY